ncbi:MAG: glycosyltransferase [Nitrospirae bacterium]|nr:MAG: glycosyltransferase [Nitrospirota bacterium]
MYNTDVNAMNGGKRDADVIVLIPHFNNLRGLFLSLESITGVEPVDVLIVDDGSKDKPDVDDLVKNFPAINEIYLLSHNENRGITYTLNKGIEFIQSIGRHKYIARLDAGDINDPERFKKQVSYLEDHSDVYLLGSHVVFVDMNGKDVFRFRPPAMHEQIKRRMYVNNMFNHSSVMFRMEALEKVGLYPTEYPHAEDYALFFRFVRNYRTANLPEFLIRYEINPKGISLRNRQRQILSRLKVIRDNFDWSCFAFYGLFRNMILLLLPYFMVEKAKTMVYR